MTPEFIPKRITGPATVKIFAPTPRITPSLRESMASLVTAFEKPVTGTRVPAPACLAMLSKTPKPVSTDAMKIRVTVTGSLPSFLQRRGRYRAFSEILP